MNYAEELRKIATSDPDPKRRQGAIERLQRRGETVEPAAAPPPREGLTDERRRVLTDKVAESKARTAHYQEIQDSDSSMAGIPSISLAPRDAGFTAKWDTSEPEPAFKPPQPPPQAAPPTPEPEPEYPGLDNMIARHALQARAQQAPEPPPETLPQMIQAAKAELQRKASDAKTQADAHPVVRANRRRQKRSASADKIRTYDPVTGDEI